MLLLDYLLRRPLPRLETRLSLFTNAMCIGSSAEKRVSCASSARHIFRITMAPRAGIPMRAAVLGLWVRELCAEYFENHTKHSFRKRGNTAGMYE